MHNDDWIVIEEEGQLRRCETCGIFQCNVGTQHKQSEGCRRWTTIKQEQLESERNKIVIESTQFTINNKPIKNTDEFKYLGRILEKNDNDWPATVNKPSPNGVRSPPKVVDKRQSRS
jgi:hypothetical protein